MNLLDILSPNALKVPLKATEKRAAIDELIDLLAEDGFVRDARDLKKVVWERESQRSTGIGEGLAIPHGKTASLDALVMAVGKPAEPMEFGAIDQKPVRLIVLLASPPNKTADHIQALGKISRMMGDAELRARAYQAQTADELFELFQQHAG